MKLKILIASIFILSLIGTVNAVGVQPNIINVTAENPGDIVEAKFSLILDNETVNLDLKYSGDSAWFPYTNFPLSYSGTGEFNVTLPIKIPSTYSQSEKVLWLVANSTATSIEFNITVNIIQPVELVEKWNDWVNSGENLNIGSLVTISVMSSGITNEQLLIGTTGCPFSSVILQKNISKYFVCSGIPINITYLDNFNNLKAKIRLYTTEEQIVTKTESPMSELRIVKLSRVCPNKLAILKITDMFGSGIDGTVTITTSLDEAVDSVSLQNGYAKFVVPPNEYDYLTLQIDPTNGNLVMEVLPISSNCETPLFNQTNETKAEKKLKLIAFETSKQIPADKDSVFITVVVRDSETERGVEGATIVVYKDGSINVVQSGMAGYKNMVFNEPGDYILHAESDNYKSSDEVKITITKEVIPKLHISAFENNSEVYTIQKNKVITFKILDENNNIYPYNGDVRMVYDEGKETYITFTDGIAKFKASVNGDYVFMLSELKNVDAVNQRFIVEESFDFSPFIFWIFVLVVILAIVIYLKKKRPKPKVGYGFPEEEKFLGKVE
ncbi:MAG: hypothetical protein ACTSV7_00865 [Candidatus Baldrarchaeia archaeon]